MKTKTTKQQEIDAFFAQDGWCIDDTTPKHIEDAFYAKHYVDPDAPAEPDLTPIFHGGVCVGSRQDLKDGTIDPTDRDAWKP